MPADPDSSASLLAENARLAALLDAHGIAWRIAEQPAQYANEPTTGHAVFNADEKIAMFRRLFGGRTDIYAVRWENKAGKSGYAPACANEWKPGVCEKPRIKCSECPNRKFLPLTDQVIYDHLTGRHVIGGYPLLQHLVEAEQHGIGTPRVRPGRCCAKFAHAEKISEPNTAEHRDCSTKFGINRRFGPISGFV